MARTLLFFLFAQFVCFSLHAQGKTEDIPVKTQQCEQATGIALEKLVPIFQKNNFENLEAILNTFQNSCGENELIARLRILRALIEKNNTESMIVDYSTKGYNRILQTRWIGSAEGKYANTYKKHKDTFYFVPLRHPIDSLTKIKAWALLNSPSYTLNQQEKNIALLFADQDRQTIDPQPADDEEVPPTYTYKQRNGVSIYAGAEFPWADTYSLFKKGPAFGLFYATKLSNPILVELGMKLRVNSKANQEFEYLFHDKAEITSSGVSIGLGTTVGYKVFDNDKFIVSPKAGLFWEISPTGLADLTTTYHTDEYSSYEEEGLSYRSIHTLRTTIGLAVMRHLSGKTYIGLEGAYHFVPYNWDKDLLTRVQPHYGSLQVFIRF